MISYKLVENSKDSLQFLDRILKYRQRGFRLIVPYSFREKNINDCISLMVQNKNIVKDAKDEDDKYNDFQLNNDTMKVRNNFVELCSRLYLDKC